MINHKQDMYYQGNLRIGEFLFFFFGRGPFTSIPLEFSNSRFLGSNSNNPTLILPLYKGAIQTIGTVFLHLKVRHSLKVRM